MQKMTKSFCKNASVPAPCVISATVSHNTYLTGWLFVEWRDAVLDNVGEWGVVEFE